MKPRRATHATRLGFMWLTCHLSVLERSDQPGSGALRARLAHLPPAEVVTAIVSCEEHKRGLIAYLARTRSMAQQGEA